MCCTYWARVFVGGGAGAEIVVAFGQSQASLVDDGNLLARVLEILLFAEVEKRVYADQLKAGEEFGQFVFALESCNAIKLHLQRRQSLLVDGVHIHAGGVGVANLLLVGSAAGAARGGFFQHGVQDVFGMVGDHGAGAVGGTIVRDGIEFRKIAAGVLEKIGARVGRGVDQSCLSRPGRRSGAFAGSGFAGGCAFAPSQEAHKADTSDKRSHICFIIRFFPLRLCVHAVDKPTQAFDGRAWNL